MNVETSARLQAFPLNGGSESFCCSVIEHFTRNSGGTFSVSHTPFADTKNLLPDFAISPHLTA